jgi:hypothetical protein
MAAAQPAVSSNGQHNIQLSVSDDDIKVITNGLLTLSKALSDPAVSAALQRLVDLFTKAAK